MSQISIQDNLSLEDALIQLEEVINSLEQPELSLESSFQKYQLGMELIKHCTKTIDGVEQKVLLLGNGGELNEF